MNAAQVALLEAAAYVLLANPAADPGYTAERRNDIARELLQAALRAR